MPPNKSWYEHVKSQVPADIYIEIGALIDFYDKEIARLNKRYKDVEKIIKNNSYIDKKSGKWTPIKQTRMLWKLQEIMEADQDG